MIFLSTLVVTAILAQVCMKLLHRKPCREIRFSSAIGVSGGFASQKAGGDETVIYVVMEKNPKTTTFFSRSLARKVLILL
ncbi:MAG: hypothetical protein A2040_04330 [Rhodocyclales bacterium GWA2_65_19]|nr:MAG: hypothetical protein A2040_04330 [Rhodocyclales bacterium GWA2_65_19]